MSDQAVPASASPIANALVNGVIQENLPTGQLKGLGDPTPVDAPATEEAPKTPANDEASRKFSALAKKEKAIYQRDQEMKAREAKLQETIEARVQEEIAKIKSLSPLERLKAVGTEYSEVTDYLLNDGAPTTERQLKAMRDEFEAYKKAQEDKGLQAEKTAKERQEAELARHVEEFKGQISQHVADNTEKYELINLFKTEDAIYDTIDAYYQKHGKVLAVEEAAGMVEKYLDDQVAMVQKTKKYGKPAESGKEETAASPVSPEDGFQKPSKAPNRLSNDIMPTGASFIGDKQEKDRFSRAMAALDRNKK